MVLVCEPWEAVGSGANDFTPRFWLSFGAAVAYAVMLAASNLILNAKIRAAAW